MAITAAGGFPQLSGTLVPNNVWSTNLLVKFYDATVFGAIANTDYEEDVKRFGDKVNIRTTPSITIHDYEKGGVLQTQTPDPQNVTLTIDKAKYWNFLVDDVDRFQSDLDFMENWTQAAALDLEVAIDSGVLTDEYPNAHASNQGATAGSRSGNINLGATGAPLRLTKGNVIDTLALCEQTLAEQNVPEYDRWLVIPQWVARLIRTSDAKNAEMLGDSESMIRGTNRIGRLHSFSMCRTNQLATTTDGSDTVTNIMFGQKKALSFASQFVENALLISELQAGHKCRGLQVYGHDVLKAEALGLLYAVQG